MPGGLRARPSAAQRFRAPLGFAAGHGGFGLAL